MTVRCEAESNILKKDVTSLHGRNLYALYHAAVTPSHKSPSCKSHVRLCLWNGMGHGFLVAVLVSTWLLQGLHGCYGVHVSLFFFWIASCGSYGMAFREGVTGGGGGGGVFHRTCHQWQLVIHWLLPWQQCFIANQNQECHFICRWKRWERKRGVLERQEVLSPGTCIRC